jgi:(S)-ureidoglycine aminohydrolase
MRTFILSILLFIFGFSIAQKPIVKPGNYGWPTANGTSKNSSIVMLSGSGTDLSNLEIMAEVLATGEKKKVQLTNVEEHLVLVKSGVLTITIKDSTFSLVKGSIALIMPGEKYSVNNSDTAPCEFHVMKYQSKAPVDLARGKSSGGSFVRDWNKLTFKPHDRGGVRPYFTKATAMSKRFEMHVTTLNEGNISHPPHTHRAEEIILVLEGNVDILIGENRYKGKPGDVLFLPSNLPHGLTNDGKGQCVYFAYQWE